MREIKFRGKRVDNGEWVFGNYFIDERDIEDGFIWRDIPQIQQRYGDHYQYYDVDPSTVGQYTGLKDKNGKEIYRDDIVLATYGKWHEEPKGLTRICKVVYDDKTCSFRMAVNNSKVTVSFGDSRSKDIEVIGNIHDNPELIHDQKAEV